MKNTSTTVDPKVKTSSVYLLVTPPKHRPIIPKGGLAPAPPGRKMSGGSPKVAAVPKITATPVVAASSAGKWANRLRERR